MILKITQEDLSEVTSGLTFCVCVCVTFLAADEIINNKEKEDEI